MWNTKALKTSTIRVCAWCKRINVSGEWIIPIHDRSVAEKVTHGICPPCRTKQLDEERLDNS